MTNQPLTKYLLVLIIVGLFDITFPSVPVSESISEHSNFIMKTKNSNDAFVSFQRIIANDLKNKNYSKVNDKIDFYKNVFIEKFEGFDSTRFEDLYEIINSEDEQEIFRKNGYQGM